MRNDSFVEDGVVTVSQPRYAVCICDNGKIVVRELKSVAGSDSESQSNERFFAISADHADGWVQPNGTNGKSSRFGPGDVLDIALDRAMVKILGNGYRIRSLRGVGVLVYQGAKPRLSDAVEASCPRIGILASAPF